MIPPPTAIYRRAGLLIWLAMVVVYFASSIFSLNRSLNLVLIGLVYGTTFQHALLAGLWCVLGPAPLIWRVPLSFIWAVLMGLMLLLPRSMTAEDPAGDAVVVISVALWLAVQLPLWILAPFFRLRLWHQGTVVDDRAAQQSQFGIGQLMAFTAFVAVVLAGGRLLLAYQQQQPGATFVRIGSFQQ